VRRLIGRVEQSIDPKGRLVLPSNHRERYVDAAILSLRGDHLAVYEPEAWDEFIAKLSARLEAGEVPRHVFNQIAGDAVDLRPDSAGRILIPQPMRTEIGLDREVIVQGAITYLGIYPKTAETSHDLETRSQARQLVDSIGI
jgi:MraZ protein